MHLPSLPSLCLRLPHRSSTSHHHHHRHQMFAARPLSLTLDYKQNTQFTRAQQQSAPLSMATCATTTVCAVTTRTPSRRAASATLAGAELAALSVRKPDNHTATVPSCGPRQDEARQDEAHHHCLPFLSEVSVSSGMSATSVVLIIACILLAVIMGSV